MKHVITCLVALSFAFSAACAEDAKPAASAEGASNHAASGSAASSPAAAARKLMDSYYATTRKAKNIEEVVPFMSKRNVARMKANPAPAEMMDFAMELIRSSAPITYKVVSEKAEPERVSFVLESKEFPPDPMGGKPKDLVAHGDFVVVHEAGEWKVDKDYWTAKSADGTFKMSFGTNPDEKKDP